MSIEHVIPYAYFEPHPDTEYEPDFTWFNLPQCERCHGEREVNIRGQWVLCGMCKGEGFIDPNEDAES